MYEKIQKYDLPYIIITHECMKNREGFLDDDGSIISINKTNDKYTPAVLFGNKEDGISVIDYIKDVAVKRALDINRLRIFVDEGQFFCEGRIKEFKSLSYLTDVYVFALRSDYNGNMFNGSKILAQLADYINVVKRVCSQCGKRLAVFDAKVDDKMDLDSKYKQVCFCCFYSINI